MATIYTSPVDVFAKRGDIAIKLVQETGWCKYNPISEQRSKPELKPLSKSMVVVLHMTGTGHNEKGT